MAALEHPHDGDLGKSLVELFALAPQRPHQHRVSGQGTLEIAGRDEVPGLAPLAAADEGITTGELLDHTRHPVGEADRHPAAVPLHRQTVLP